MDEASVIRDAVFHEIPWDAEPDIGMDVFKKTADELASIFQERVGAVKCQGACHYLHLKYLAKGWDSWVVGVGTGIRTHALVLVKRGGGWVVQDPKRNVSCDVSILDVISELAVALFLYQKAPSNRIDGVALDEIRARLDG